MKNYFSDSSNSLCGVSRNVHSKKEKVLYKTNKHTPKSYILLVYTIFLHQLYLKNAFFINNF